MFEPPATSYGNWTRVFPTRFVDRNEELISSVSRTAFVHSGNDRAWKAGVTSSIRHIADLMLFHPSLQAVRKQAQASSLTRLNIPDCIRTFNSTLQASFSNLYVVVDGESRRSSLLDGYQAKVDNECSLCWMDQVFCQGQICDQGPHRCHCAWPITEKSSKLTYHGSQFVALDAPAQYCLAQNASEHCTIQLHVGLLATVAICNVVECLCLITISFAHLLDSERGSGLLELAVRVGPLPSYCKSYLSFAKF